jgi:hypothetical protein
VTVLARIADFFAPIPAAEKRRVVLTDANRRARSQLLNDERAFWLGQLRTAEQKAAEAREQLDMLDEMEEQARG